MSLKTDWSTQYRQQVGNLLDTLKELAELRRAYDALGLSQELVDADCAEPGYTVTADELRGAVTSISAINDFIASNWHTTILYKIARR